MRERFRKIWQEKLLCKGLETSSLTIALSYAIKILLKNNAVTDCFCAGTGFRDIFHIPTNSENKNKKKKEVVYMTILYAFHSDVIEAAIMNL